MKNSSPQKKDEQEEWHFFIFLQISLVSGLIEDSRIHVLASFI